MTAMLITVLRAVLACIILAVTPLLLALRFARADIFPTRLCAACILAILLALAAALGLHVAGIPITTVTLACVHLALFAVALALFRFPRRYLPSPPDPSCAPPDRSSHFLLSAFCFLLFLLLPYTHFTGIDTYKWQDLATSVRMEKSLPWIVHPLSLLGFTPRAYPPAHPVLLATVQMVGNLGVEGGFAVVSLFTALLGLASATCLARRLLPPTPAMAVGVLYCLSPVFIRYAHWATGRGLFLAIFPAFIAALLPDAPGARCATGKDRPSRSIALLRRTAILVTLALLLLLTHKVALVAVPLTLLAAAAAPLLPRRLPSAARIALTLPFLAAAAAIATPALFPGPAGLPPGLLRTAVMRFAWMFPFAVAGLWLPSAPGNGAEIPSRAWTMMLLAALPALTLAFERQMYGALYALPFLCIFAAGGLDRLGALLSPRRRQILLAAVAGITLAGAVTTVVARSRIAASPALHAAAMFLEAYDPQGPFMIHAPGIARSRILAYVSGCARFAIRPGADARLQWPDRPPWKPTLRTTADAWASWLRALFSLSDTETLWYGNPRRHYHFVIGGRGSAPGGATLIYDRDGIAIHESTP